MDLPARAALDLPVQTVSADAVLLADGAFLLRPELDSCWDLRIYGDIGFDEVMRRGVARDQQWMDSAADAEHRYRTRYIPAERRYLEEVRPSERAGGRGRQRGPSRTLAAGPDLTRNPWNRQKLAGLSGGDADIIYFYD